MMKKIISVFLAALMLFSAVSAGTSALAADEYYPITYSQKTPMVHIGGDGTPLTYPDGKRAIYYKNVLEMFKDSGEDEGKNRIVESVVNVCTPFLLQGLASGNYEPYYAALKKEVGDLFADVLLDGNGDPISDVGVDPERVEKNRLQVTTPNKSGNYSFFDYQYFYDWRLDPFKNVDALDEYINGVLAMTGAEKVGIVTTCLGGSLVAAYVKKFGMSKIKGVSFEYTTVNGSEPVSEAISGKFHVDPDAVNRFLIDSDFYNLFSIDDVVTTTIEFIDNAYIAEGLTLALKKTVYSKVVEGVTSALALSTLFTWPSFWAAVTPENYDDALLYVFGKEGSEKRKEYAGLIEQIEHYHNDVMLNMKDILNEIAENGNIATIVKYGSQMAPICRSADLIGDQVASVKLVSFGATTSTVYDTLSDEYIKKQIESGLGKYISPDKQIDASTCQFPDSTFFIKGATHSVASDVERSIAATFSVADRQLSADEIELGRFIVCPNNDQEVYKMTEENCDTYHWKADEKMDKPKGKYAKLFLFVTSLLKFLMMLINLMTQKQEAVPTTAN